MKITFLGVGSSFTTMDYYQSNMLITASSGRKLLIDCGTDIRFALNENHTGSKITTQDIDAIYISHLHADHIGGLEWLAFSSYFSSTLQKITLFMEENLMRELWESSLKGGLGCIEHKLMHLTDYFACHPVGESGSFTWEEIRFALVRMPHVVSGYKNHYSYGLLIREMEGGPSVFITTDTKFYPNLLDDFSEGVDIIFHDCETMGFKTGIHAHYEELRTLPPELKGKMWLYHYQPSPRYDPQADGFLGFVVKGQEFDLGDEVP